MGFNLGNILSAAAPIAGSILGGPIGAAVGAIGSGLLADQGASAQAQANLANQSLTREGMIFNAQQASLQRDWAERMSNTSWQRATKDMMAAGLNPMLAYSQGGASTPTGSSASSVQPIQQQNTALAGIQYAASSAQIANQLADVKLKDSQADLNRAQVPKVQQEVKRIAADTGLTEAQTERVASEIKSLQSQASRNEWEAYRTRVEAEIRTWQFKWKEPEELAILSAKAQLLGLEIPESLNKAVAQQKYKLYFQNVQPFLPAATTVSNIVNKLPPLIRR